jgi:hypothetical protein
MSQRQGSFVVYGTGSMTLAVRMQHAVKHFAVERMEGSPPRFRLALDANQPWHLDLVSLVEFYQTPRQSVPFVLVRQSSLPLSSPLVVSDFAVGDGSGFHGFERSLSKRTEEDLRSFKPLILRDELP